MAKEQPEIRKSVIKKGLRRTIKTAEYEGLVIEESIEEIVEWSTLQERNTKIDNWEKIFFEKYKDFHNKVLEQFGFDHKKAFFKNPSESTKSLAKKMLIEDSKPEDLDSLDILR